MVALARWGLGGGVLAGRSFGLSAAPASSLQRCSAFAAAAREEGAPEPRPGNFDQPAHSDGMRSSETVTGGTKNPGRSAAQWIGNPCGTLIQVSGAFDGGLVLLRCRVFNVLYGATVASSLLLACGSPADRLDGIRPDEVSALGLTQGFAGRAGELTGCGSEGMCWPACSPRPCVPTGFERLDADVAAYPNWDSVADGAEPCTLAGTGFRGLQITQAPEHRATPDADGIYGIEVPTGAWTVGVIDSEGCVVPVPEVARNLTVDAGKVVTRDLLLFDDPI